MGWGRENWSLHSTRNVFPANFNVQKKQAPREVLRERSLWAGPLLHVPRQRLLLGFRDRIFPWEASEIPWSHPSFVVIATWWITKDIGFYQTSISIWLFMASAHWQWIPVFLTKRTLICSATPHFSTHSSFMILMRVFFQETHISLFDLGASVRIFLILLWHSESVNVFHICLMLFRDIYDHLLVTQGKVCRNFF